MNDPELERIKSVIVDKCRSFWQERRKVYLLSRVGLDLPGIGQYIRGATGKNLRGFIQADLGDALRTEQWSHAKNIWGIFPKDAVLTEEIDSYFEFPRPEPKEDRSVPRYNPRFWAAFAVPLSPGERRYISLDNPVTFENVPEVVEPTLGKLEIDRALIPPATQPNRDKVILENIQTWLKKFGIDESHVLLKWSAEHSGQEVEPRSELEYLIEAIGVRDLSRVHLPLDLVARLLKRRKPR